MEPNQIFYALGPPLYKVAVPVVASIILFGYSREPEGLIFGPSVGYHVLGVASAPLFAMTRAL